MRPTSQNTSAAVMQRRMEPPDSLDYFPTPPWAVRALCRFLETELGEDLSKRSCWEPACGEGFMARPLAEAFGSLRVSDVIEYPGFEHEVLDFVGYPVWAKRDAVDWIITNPPFIIADQFIKRSLRLGRRGVVMLLRSNFAEGVERYAQLFEPAVAPAYIVTFTERVVMAKNRLVRYGALDPFNYDPTTYQPKRASSATSYSLFIWRPDEHDSRHRWIPPCRVSLEREEDYPAYKEQWAWLRMKQDRASGQGGLL